MKLIVTTSRRHTTPPEPSGYVYTIDLWKKKTIRCSQIIEPAFRELDNNPRGGMRGCKGISISDNLIAIANSSMIFLYDHKWNLQRIITHPSCAGIHDILFHGNTLWVTSARNDLLMQFDLSGNLLLHYYLRLPIKELNWKPTVLLLSDNIVNGTINFRDPRTHNSDEFNKAHVNSVCILQNSDILVSLGLIPDTKFSMLLQAKSKLIQLGLWSLILRVNSQFSKLLGSNTDNRGNLKLIPAKAKSALIRILPDGSHILSLDLTEMTVPSHSLILLPDNTVIYLNTTKGSVIHYEPISGNLISSTKVTNGFLRGITRIAPHTFILGSSGELLTFDLSNLQVTDSMKFSSDPLESVFDIDILPSAASLPPKSFADQLDVDLIELATR